MRFKQLNKATTEKGANTQQAQSFLAVRELYIVFYSWNHHPNRPDRNMATVSYETENAPVWKVESGKDECEQNRPRQAAPRNEGTWKSWKKQRESDEC